MNLALILLVSCLVVPTENCRRILSNRNRFDCDFCRCSTNELSNLTVIPCSRRCESVSNANSVDLDDEIHLKSFDDQSLTEIFSSKRFWSRKRFSNLILEKISSKNLSRIVPSSFFNVNLLKIVDSTIFEENYRRKFRPTNFVSIGASKIFSSVDLNFCSTIDVRHSNETFSLSSSFSTRELILVSVSSVDLFGVFPNLFRFVLTRSFLRDEILRKIFVHAKFSSLVELDLSNNDLTTIDELFPSTIRRLDLSNNKIRSIDEFSMKNLFAANFLNFSFNAPLEIRGDAFRRVPFLENLDLTATRPIFSAEKTFLPLKKLRFCNFSRNELKKLPKLPTPISKNENQSLHVDLSRNSISNLDFLDEPTRRKIKIDFTENPSLCECSKRKILAPNVEIRKSRCETPIDFAKLKIEPNSTEFCEEKNFCPKFCFCFSDENSTIFFVNCSGRNLQTTPENLPEFVTHLDLSRNSIRLVDPKIFSKLDKLEFLDFSQNPFEQEFSTSKIIFLIFVATIFFVFIFFLRRKPNKEEHRYASIPNLLEPNRNFSLDIKLDVLVLYSIDESIFVHRILARNLEKLYANRFTFYFIHRDRRIGQIDWLIDNSCVTLFIAPNQNKFRQNFDKFDKKFNGKPIFIVFLDQIISPDQTLSKISRNFRTSNIFSWNEDPKSSFHQNFEIFLRKNCGSASYVGEI